MSERSTTWLPQGVAFEEHKLNRSCLSGWPRNGGCSPATLFYQALLSSFGNGLKHWSVRNQFHEQNKATSRFVAISMTPEVRRDAHAPEGVRCDVMQLDHVAPLLVVRVEQRAELRARCGSNKQHQSLSFEPRNKGHRTFGGSPSCRFCVGIFLCLRAGMCGFLPHQLQSGVSHTPWSERGTVQRL